MIEKKLGYNKRKMLLQIVHTNCLPFLIGKKR